MPTRPQLLIGSTQAPASRRASLSSCWAVDNDEDMAERHRPAGVVERDRPRPPAAAIDVGYPVRLTVIVDNVARLNTIGVDRGHRVCVALRSDTRIPGASTRPEPHRAPPRRVFHDTIMDLAPRECIGESPCSACAGRIPTAWIPIRDVPERRHRTTNAAMATERRTAWRCLSSRGRAVVGQEASQDRAGRGESVQHVGRRFGVDVDDADRGVRRSGHRALAQQKIEVGLGGGLVDRRRAQ